MSGIESTLDASRRWLVRPAVLLALIMVLVVARTGCSNATEAEREEGNRSDLALPDPSLGTGGAGGPDPTMQSRSPDQLDVAPAVLRLEGRVVDPDDHAVGGARVTLGGAQVALGGGRVVETEADGSFAFDDLPEGKYDITAEHGDQYAESQDVRLDESSEPVMLTLVRGPTLILHVTDPRGQPIPGATVELASRTFVTGTDGATRIRGVATDDEFVIVSAKGHARVRERVTTSDDPAATIEWTVVLVAGAEIAGTVVDQDGKPIPEAYVELEEANGDRSDSAFTDETGSWHLADIGAGKYVMRASSKLHIAAADLALDHDGAHPMTGVVLHVAPGGEISGIVVDDAGKPVAEARVTTGSGSETTDEGGRFVVHGLGPDKYDVTASTQALGAASQQVVLARGQHVEVKIVLTPSSIAGVVVDANGHPVEDASVFARADVPNGYAFEHTDAYGHFDLGGLPPGSYQLTAQRSESRVDSPAVQVTTGNRHVRLVVPDQAGITGRVVLDGKPVAYYGFSINEDPADTYDRPTPVRDPDGRFIQRDVAPGTFAVIIVGPGFARRVVAAVHVVSGRVTDVGDIVVTRGDSVRGRVVDERGAGIANATVRLTSSSYSMVRTGLGAIMQGDLSATTDARGHYEVVGLQGSTEGRRIEAVHPTLGMSGYRVLAAGETEVELVIAATGSIDGTLVRPRRNTTHIVASRIEDRDAQYHAEAAPSGTFQFPQLPPGEYNVRVLGRNAPPAIHATVTAGAPTVVTLEFPANPVELRVHVVAGCSLISVRTRDSDELLRLESCTDGRVTMADLAPGPYQLCLELSECQPIDLPATPVHTVEIDRPADRPAAR